MIQIFNIIRNVFDFNIYGMEKRKGDDQTKLILTQEEQKIIIYLKLILLEITIINECWQKIIQDLNQPKRQTLIKKSLLSSLCFNSQTSNAQSKDPNDLFKEKYDNLTSKILSFAAFYNKPSISKQYEQQEEKKSALFTKFFNRNNFSQIFTQQSPITDPLYAHLILLLLNKNKNDPRIFNSIHKYIIGEQYSLGQINELFTVIKGSKVKTTLSNTVYSDQYNYIQCLNIIIQYIDIKNILPEYKRKLLQYIKLIIILLSQHNKHNSNLYKVADIQQIHELMPSLKKYIIINNNIAQEISSVETVDRERKVYIQIDKTYYKPHCHDYTKTYITIKDIKQLLQEDLQTQQDIELTQALQSINEDEMKKSIVLNQVEAKKAESQVEVNEKADKESKSEVEAKKAESQVEEEKAESEDDNMVHKPPKDKYLSNKQRSNSLSSLSLNTNDYSKNRSSSCESNKPKSCQLTPNRKKIINDNDQSTAASTTDRSNRKCSDEASAYIDINLLSHFNDTTKKDENTISKDKKITKSVSSNEPIPITVIKTETMLQIIEISPPPLPLQIIIPPAEMFQMDETIIITDMDKYKPPQAPSAEPPKPASLIMCISTLITYNCMRSVFVNPQSKIISLKTIKTPVDNLKELNASSDNTQSSTIETHVDSLQELNVSSDNTQSSIIETPVNSLQELNVSSDNAQSSKIETPVDNLQEVQ